MDRKVMAKAPDAMTVRLVLDADTRGEIQRMIATEISVQLGIWLSACVDRRMQLDAASECKRGDR